ncbi:hypothetical protein AK812_SmicGene4858 [Symbiodinium microadriaticum]|uniref:Uncharacterized protein n=1 Tax=Symbiodinium microadriaticum TaxID=2951 RepID=A0A1Q9EV74_SYMMI|nr:hypothetical protein AK812_SmicGene4858 [Symbiodinium microadriaticum]
MRRYRHQNTDGDSALSRLHRHNLGPGLSLPLVRTSSRASRAWILPSWGDYATQLESLEHRELGDHNTLLGRVTPAKPGILSISCAGAGDSWPTSSPSAGSRLVGRPDEANRAWSASAALVSAHQATPLEHCEHQPLAFLTTTPCCHHEHQLGDTMSIGCAGSGNGKEHQLRWVLPSTPRNLSIMSISCAGSADGWASIASIMSSPCKSWVTQPKPSMMSISCDSGDGWANPSIMIISCAGSRLTGRPLPTTPPNPAIVSMICAPWMGHHTMKPSSMRFLSGLGDTTKPEHREHQRRGFLPGLGDLATQPKHREHPPCKLVPWLGDRPHHDTPSSMSISCLPGLGNTTQAEPSSSIVSIGCAGSCLLGPRCPLKPAIQIIMSIICAILGLGDHTTRAW